MGAILRGRSDEFRFGSMLLLVRLSRWTQTRPVPSQACLRRSHKCADSADPFIFLESVRGVVREARCWVEPARPTPSKHQILQVCGTSAVDLDTF
jgi:hypothetical protein